MPRPKRAPDSDSRESPAFWNLMFTASHKRRERDLIGFNRFSRWFSGDLSDVVDPSTILGGASHGGGSRNSGSASGWNGSLENMTALATVAAMADLMFRYPRFVVRYPYTFPPFTPQLAECEMKLLNYSVRQVNYLKRARRSLQDSLLGGIGILKITMDAEIAIDQETLEAAYAEAQDEVVEFMQGKSIKASESQIHSVHIEVKSNWVTLVEREQIKDVPKSAVKYMRKHINHHKAMKGSERPLETIRASRIRVRRVNPNDYFWDPTVDDRDDASWRGCQYLVRKKDILANDSYSREARKEIPTITDRWTVRRQVTEPLKSMGSYDIPEEMCMVREVYDLVEQKRRLWIDGAAHPLLVEDRHDLASIQPSGPFSELVLMEDVMESGGIAPPKHWEGEQAVATFTAAAHATAAIQALPRTLYDSTMVDAAEAERAWTSPAAALIPVENKMATQGRKLSDAFENAPTPEISEESLFVRQAANRGIERRSGLGAAKMAGGDFANTATASALVADAATSLSEDRGALVDAWSEYNGRMMSRLHRRFLPVSAVAEICGPLSQHWPRWGMRDVSNDVGIDIVPGSSRRRNTSVEQKQLLDLVGGMSKDPAMQGVAAQSMRVDLYQQYAEDGGATGLDWEPIKKELAMQAALQQALADQATAPQESSGSPDEGKSPEPNDQQQGVANVGGGRVPTGASIGDRVRQVRGEATERVASRE